MFTDFTRLGVCICTYLLFLTNGASSFTKDRHANKTYVVTTILSEPYVMYKDRNAGNFSQVTQPIESTLEGLFVELLEVISKEVGFKYRIQLVADSRYGHEFEKDTWNGMIGELVNETADMAMGDITLTGSRAKVVTFSQPVLDGGLRILYKKPTLWAKVESAFILLTPFKATVWIVLIVVFVIASVLLYLVGRFSPLERDEKTNRPPAALSPDKCFLYTFKALTWQGMGIMPKSFSVRVFIATWWSVCLIVVACYIANLTAFFLTKEPPVRFTPFLTFGELSRQTEVKYGIVQYGSSYQFFKNSNRNMEKRMFSYMTNQKPSVFVNNYKEGLKRVRESNGRYALIAESTFMEYQSNRLPCDLMTVGEQLNSYSYGFACTKSEDDLCKDIDAVILLLKERGAIHPLKTKWFSGPCSAQQEDELLFEGNLFFDSASKTDLKMEKAVSVGRMLSVWIIFIVGSILSFLVLGIEICVYRRKQKKEGRRDVPEDHQRIEEFYDE